VKSIKLKEMKIGKFSLKYPIIQGGMGIGISLGNLAGSVAREGGVGVISMVDIGYEEKDFYTNTIEANKRAFRKELQKAREIAKGSGIIAVNIMRAINNFEEYVKVAAEEKIDAIIVGAGLPINLPELVKGSDVMIAPIVSSARALRLIITKWKNSYQRLPDFIVVEGPRAGGHLGFSKEEVEDEQFSIQNITKQVFEYLKSNESIIGKIPFFSAGGINSPEDVNEIISLGADGVQAATPFILTNECDASDGYKKVIQQSTKDDLRIMKSPVGLIGRAVNTPFLQKISLGRIAPTRCIDCIQACNPKTTIYCITEALINAVRGDYENGLFFCGANAGNGKEIKSVKEVIEELVSKLK